MDRKVAIFEEKLKRIEIKLLLSLKKKKKKKANFKNRNYTN